MSRLQITSEIYAETDFNCLNVTDEKSISRFSFSHPNEDIVNDNEEVKKVYADNDGDLIVPRKRRGAIEIEHHKSTDLTLVGLQVWRGALLLADYILHNHKMFHNRNVVELGSGVGLTGIAAGMYAQRVICTDINLGGILNLIEDNIRRNSKLINNNMGVLELDFKTLNWNNELETVLNSTQIILAADVIYDDDLTEAFVATLEKLLRPASNNEPKVIFIALEKRYVFTVANLESLAPCYEYFLECMEKIRYKHNWKFESIPISFPQYFNYERVKDLVLLKLSL